MGTPHVMVVPYPAQGHVIPMLELSLWLVKHGIKVTFVNTHFNHQRVVKSLSEADDTQELVTMVSIPDGLESCEDRNDLEKLETLVERINEKAGEIITCVIADWTTGWALEVAEKLGLRRAAFWSAAAAVLALSLNIPKLVNDGIIDSNGESSCIIIVYNTANNLKSAGKDASIVSFRDSQNEEKRQTNDLT